VGRDLKAGPPEYKEEVLTITFGEMAENVIKLC
jgi:hypothetical protein